MDNALDKGILALNNVKKSLERIDDCIYPLENLSYAEVCSQLKAIEAVKLDVSMAFSIASLYYVSLCVKGVNTQNHPIKDELNRIKGYVEKISKLEESRKRKLELDVPAASRAIQFEILKNPKKA